MPKPSRGKKREARSKKDRLKKKPKRMKFSEEITSDDIENVCEEILPKSADGEDENEDSSEGEDFEEMLEEHAAKNNLSAINVKSILHHVVTDKRVLDLVQKVIAEETAKGKGRSTNECSPGELSMVFEPKMTRSKFKQKHLDDPIAQLTQSPMKRKKPISTFTDLEFPESSSDEEYDPDEDEDEDTESYTSYQSDLASPSIPPSTPDKVQTDSQNDSEETAASVSRPLTRHRSQEIIFKKPETVATPDKNDLIAKRTRSLLPIKESLEYYTDAMLPDYMPDLYDTIKLDDLDNEDIAFQLFLQSLINGDDEDVMTEEDDYEYDFMAENHKEEKEEYRNDRAVRIPKKEVSDLFEELLNEFDQNGEMPDDSSLWTARALLDDDSSNKDVVLFTSQQRNQLSFQMHQHVQLLTQIHLLSREDPTLQNEADICRQYVNELQGFCERASSTHINMAMRVSAFVVPGLQDAVRIVSEPFNAVRRPRSPRKQAASPSTSTNTKNKPPRSPVSSTNQAIMANNSLFHQNELLPRYGFTSKDPNAPKDSSSLRVKFTEAEDNLLALGMHQFQKNWKLIQTHLLPAKTPKQISIRCKNLFSSRAQDNVVKHLRDTNTLWMLPTKVVVNCSPDSRNTRRRKYSVEPEWLVAYRQKMKPARKQLLPIGGLQQTLPSIQLPTLYPAPVDPVPSVSRFQGLDMSATVHQLVGLTARPSVAQVVVGNEAAENQGSLRKISSNDNRSKESPLKTQPNSKDETGKTTTGKTTREKQTVNASDTASEVTTEKNQRNDGSMILTNTSHCQPENEQIALDMNMPDVSQVREQELPNSLSCSSTPHLDNDPRVEKPQDEEEVEDSCDDVVLDDEPTMPAEADEHTQSKPTASDEVQDKTQASAPRTTESPRPAENTAEKVAKTSPVVLTTKSKTARDSKKNCLGVIPLEPDPKEQVRAQALAESYLANVKRMLKNDQERYEEFLRTLVESSANYWTPVELYKYMEVVLTDYPELIEDFIAFLEPEQALEAGVLIENLEFLRARTFLRRIEVYFHKSPSHFKKIIEVFGTWSTGDKTPSELYEKIVPLLRGQQQLLDEFQTFFDNLKPPLCCEEDFEEVELGSGSDFEVDDFEEVVLPDVIEPKKPKGKTTKVRQNTATTKSTTTTVPGTKQKLAPKTIALDRQKPQNPRTDRRKNKPIKGMDLNKQNPSLIDHMSREDVSAPSEGEEETATKLPDGTMDPRYKKLSPELRSEGDELIAEQNPSSVRTEGSTSDCPLSVSSSTHNENSNDSVKHGEHEWSPHSTRLRTALTTVSSDNVMSDVVDEVSTDITENEENDESDNYEDNDESMYDASDDQRDCLDFRQGTLSAKNHQLGQDGQLVVLWTREDDRTILSVCHNEGATPQTFGSLSAQLNGKSSNEIKTRFEELIKLYQADAAKEVTSSEEDEDDDETDGSGTETDS